MSDYSDYSDYSSPKNCVRPRLPPILILGSSIGIKNGSSEFASSLENCVSHEFLEMADLGSPIHQQITCQRTLGRGSYGSVEEITINVVRTSVGEIKVGPAFYLSHVLSGLIDQFVDHKETYAMKTVRKPPGGNFQLEKVLKEPMVHRKISISSNNVPKFYKMVESDSKHASWAVEMCDSDLNKLIPDGGYKQLAHSLEDNDKIAEAKETWDLVKNFGKQIAQSLADIHKYGDGAHLDIKPANIMVKMPVAVGDKPRLLISDFSMETFTEFDEEKLVMPNQFTVSYGSPEMIKSSSGQFKEDDSMRKDGRIRGDLADTWMMGATMIHILTGQCPFHGQGQALIMMALLHGNIPIIPQDIPMDIRKFIEECFKPVSERKTATELIHFF